MLAIITVLLVSARRGWVEIALLLSALSVGLGLWRCGNIALLLTAVSLVPLGAIVSCGVKPYFFLFELVHFADRLRRRSTWTALGAAALLAWYSGYGLTDDQRNFIVQHRLFANDYLYVLAALLAFSFTKFGRTLVASSMRKLERARAGIPIPAVPEDSQK